MNRLPAGKQALQVLAFATTVAVVCWFFGVDVLHAILLGCAITVIALTGLVVTLTPQARELAWHGRRQAGNEGARNDVSNLSGALRGSWGQIGRTAERRLAQLARRRLALEGLDLQNPAHGEAIEALLGRPLYRALTRRGGGTMRLRRLTQCLDRLDALNPTYYPDPAKESHDR